MRKILLPFLICTVVLALCACRDPETLSEPNVQEYSFYVSETASSVADDSVSSASSVSSVGTITTAAMSSGAASSAVSSSSSFLTNSLWDDFASVQKSATYGATGTTVTGSEVNVFNYPAQSVFDYFEKLAFTDETEGDIGYIRKWEKPIYYEVVGTADSIDKTVIAWVAEQLNTIKGFPGMYEASETNKANVRYCFGNITYIQTQLGMTDATLKGFSRIYWMSGKYSILLGKIGVVSDATSREERNSVILEETLQILGLMQNAVDYPQSLFCGTNLTPQVPDEIDWALVKLLYLPSVAVGTAKADVMETLKIWLKSYYGSGVVYTDPDVDFEQLTVRRFTEESTTVPETSSVPEISSVTEYRQTTEEQQVTEEPVATTQEPTTEAPVSEVIITDAPTESTTKRVIHVDVVTTTKKSTPVIVTTSPTPVETTSPNIGYEDELPIDIMG